MTTRGEPWTHKIEKRIALAVLTRGIWDGHCSASKSCA
jgi:hypothetical protein